MLKESYNKVEIVGTLLESEVNEKATQDGREYITAKIKIRTTVDGVTSDIPVEAFSMKLTKTGALNPSYTSIQKLMTATSLAAAGGKKELASRVSIKNGRLVEDSFVDRNSEQIVTYNKITSGFFETMNVPAEDQANFIVDGCVIKQEPEVDKNDQLTGNLKVYIAVVKWNGGVDMVQFVVKNPQAIDFIKSNWTNTCTVKVGGNIVYSVETVKGKSENESIGFGEIPTSTFEKVTKQFVITAGGYPKSDENALNPAEIKSALKSRKEAMDEKVNNFKASKSNSDADSGDFEF